MSDRAGKLQVNRSNRRSFIGGSDARIIMGDDEQALVRLWREKGGEVEPEDLSGNLVVQLNRRWYKRITHRMPIGWYIVAVCYATVVILLGSWPWNVLLILLAVPSRWHDPFRFSAFVPQEEWVWSKVFCRRRGSL
jgi:hypothetical protein